MIISQTIVGGHKNNVVSLIQMKNLALFIVEDLAIIVNFNIYLVSCVRLSIKPQLIVFFLNKPELNDDLLNLYTSFVCVF